MARSPNTPKFRSPDPAHRPAIEALELTGRYEAAGNLSYYPPREHVPAHPGLGGDREPLVIRTGKRGRPPTVPMPHEAATFRSYASGCAPTRSGSSAPRLSRLPPMRTARAAARCPAPGWRQRCLPRTRNWPVARPDDGGAGGIPGHVSRKGLRATQTTASLAAQDGAPLMSPPSGARSLACTAEATGWLTSSAPSQRRAHTGREPGHLR
jgi:hypothetical protein